MGSEQFSLSWDDYHKTISNGMNSLYENEHLVDVTLAVDGRYIKAHKIVLSVCSTYFRTLFSENPCKHPIVFLKDVSYDVMSCLLTFIYKGEVQVGQEYLANFISTAEALQIKGLTSNENEKNKVPEHKKSKRCYADESKQRKSVCPSPKRVKLIESTSVDFSPPTLDTSSNNNFQDLPQKTESMTECSELQPKMEPFLPNELEQEETNVFDESQGDIYSEEVIYQDNTEDETFFESTEPKPGVSQSEETQVTREKIYSTYEEVREFIKSYETKHSVQLYEAHCTKLVAPTFRRKKLGNTDGRVVYYTLLYKCVHDGNYRPAKDHKRQSKAIGINCPMFIQFKLAKGGKGLEVVEILETHNHETVQVVCESLPLQRKQDKEKKKGLTKLCWDKNKKLIPLDRKSKLLVRLTPRDLKNMINVRNENVDNDPNETIDMDSTLDL